MLNPVAMSIIRNVFTDPRERAQAIGVWGGVVGISMALGPVVGGALTDAAGWRSIFWINVPIGILAIVLVARVVPESRAARPRRLDPHRPGAGDGLPGHADLLDHRGRRRRLELDPGAGVGDPRRGLDHRVRRTRAARTGAADRPALLPQRAVHGRDADGDSRVHRPRRVPARDEPVSPGRPRTVTGARRALHAADGCRWRSWPRRCPAESSAGTGRACRS